ncbi:flagellar biosynthesis protein FlhB [Pleomorphomonas sp. PLEO]|uniref:flagellar biosynthesis protein FlhB n=1 Tax=Pleomorphomonas sp. PLEO TaxID=3239306 RepID=UPI00351F8051
MAGPDDDSDKTEEPTQRKLEQAHEQGDVIKSMEVSTFFGLVGVTAVIGLTGSGVIGVLLSPLRGLIEHAAEIAVDGGGLRRLYIALVSGFLLSLAFPLVLMALGGIIGSLAQHRMVFSWKSLEPRFDKVSPLAGLKRMFSPESFANFIKGLLKIAALGTVMVSVLWPERDRLDALVTIDIARTILVAKSLALRMLGFTLALLFLIAAIDYFWARFRYMKRQRMSLQEVKDEHKQTEGDPHIKGRIRQLRMQRAKQRMMQKVPSATVVVTNPTHYAVALKYDHTTPAPVCVAKGADEVALRIRELAKASDVPIVENPPLARALYASVDLDETIPEQHYKAVAQVVGYVLNLKKKSNWRS